MTPLVGALAWAVLAGPEERLRQPALAARPAARGDLFNIYSPFGIAWVMALFEGTVAFVMISAAMKSMDPALEESSRVLGAGKLRTDADRHPAAGHAGRAGRHDLRVRRDAGLVRRRLRARHSRPLLRHHHGDLGGDAVAIRPTTAAPRRWGCRCSLVMFVTLTFYRWIVRPRQLTPPSPARRSGRAPMDMGRMAWVLFGAVPALHHRSPWCCRSAALLLTSFQRFATVILRQAQFTLANYETALALGPVRVGAGQQPDARASASRPSAS